MVPLWVFIFLAHVRKAMVGVVVIVEMGGVVAVDVETGGRALVVETGGWLFVKRAGCGKWVSWWLLVT